MSTLTVESTRFGSLEIDADSVIEFPAGLIGLGGTRYTIVSADPEGAFHWLHSVEDGALALPVTNPWLFFGDFVVDLNDSDTDRVANDAPTSGSPSARVPSRGTSVQTSARRSWSQKAAAIR